MAERVWTIQDLLAWTTDFFRMGGIDTPRLDAEVLLAEVLHRDRMYLYVHFDEPLEPAELAAFRGYVKERGRHVPIAYILGRREFMGLPFRVTRDTLIPRPDTEILAQFAVDTLRARASAGMEELRFADIGTGTGAIALSVLNYTEGTRADAVEISPEAAAVTAENAMAFGLMSRIEILIGDLAVPLLGRSYDMILSNPPYIPTAEVDTLMEEVRSHEPHLALDGGADGLDVYRQLMADAPDLLKEGGIIAVEVGIHEAADVASLMAAHPRIVRTAMRRDLAGIERVVIGEAG